MPPLVSILLINFIIRWVQFFDYAPPVSLVLSGVYFESQSSKNLIASPIIIATVLTNPAISASNAEVNQETTPEFEVFGTGLIGAKKVDLYFDPPLVKYVVYEDVSRYPLTENKVTLRLRHNYNWRDSAGPLSVLGVDTGGGPVKLGEKNSFFHRH